MKRGQPIDVTKIVNCGKCSIRDKCRDERKSKKFACTFFLDADPKNPSDVKFAQYLNELATSESIVADKWQIDDSDAPRAPNFYRWAIGKKFLNMDPKPYPKQIQIGLKLFNDCCYFCSPDKEWLDEIPHDADIGEIPERIQLLKHGRCPKCKRTRLDAIRKGLTVDYEDLVVVSGQRCVTGDTLVSTPEGLVEIGDLLADRPAGWSKLDQRVFLRDGGPATATAAFVSEPETIFSVLCANGLSVRGTADHPVLQASGEFKKLSEVRAGDNLYVPVGVHAWGTRSVNFPGLWTVTRDYVDALLTADRTSLAVLLDRWDQEFFVGDMYIDTESAEIARRLGVLVHGAGVACTVRGSQVVVWEGERATLTAFLRGDPIIASHYASPVYAVTVETPQVTYDLHVPEHHEFVAGGLVQHNSGKCVVGGTWVRTDSGLKQIRNCTTSDRAMLSDRSHAITKFWKRPKKTCYALKSTMGYEVRGTPDHKVMTVVGFRPMREAKTVRVETTYGPFPSRIDWLKSRASGVARKAFLQAKSGKADWLTYFSLLSEDALSAAVREYVVEELFSEGTLGLKFKTGALATAFHQILLTFGIVSSLTGSILRIVQPWSRRYVRYIGVKDKSIAASVSASIRRCNPYVHTAIAELLDKACRIVEPTEYQPPAITSAWAEYTQKMYARTFRRGDVRGAYTTLQALKTKDDFIKHMALSLMRSSVSPDAVWDTVVSCKPVKAEEVYDIEVTEMHAFVANGLVVHNSTSIGLLASYQTHLLLKLKNPPGFYGIKQGTILYSSIVGLTYGGAKTNVWDPLLATIQDSPWYQTYDEILNEAAARRGEEELARVKDTYIFYRNAGLYMSPASPSRRTLRGKTRIMATVDELAHFSSNNKLVNISGIEVWNALSRSMQTVRLGVYKLRKRGVVNIPPAMQVAISSAYETTDPIMTLYNKPTSKTYAVLYPTWEFNPDMTFEFLKPEFDRDSVTAWRDYGSRPPYSAASFVANIDPYRRTVKKNARPCASAETYIVSRKGKRVLTAAKLKWHWSDKTIGKVLAIDAGSHFNAFSVVVAHLSKTEKTVYDCLIEIHPSPGRPISFTRIYEDVIVPLVEKMNVKVLVSDRWQNKKIHDDAEDKLGIVPIEHKLKYGDLLDWREALMEGNLELPRAEISPQDILYPPEELKTFVNRPVASFIYESLRVVDVPGKRVEKPSEGSDDVWRAGVLAHTALQLPDVREVLTAGDVEKRVAGGLGAVATSGRVGFGGVVPNVAARAGGIANRTSSGVGVLRRA